VNTAIKCVAALVVGLVLSALSANADASAWIRLDGPAQTSYTAPATFSFQMDSGVIGTGPKAEYLENIRLMRDSTVVSRLPAGTHTEHGLSAGTYQYVMRATAVRHVNGDEFRRNLTSTSFTITVASPPSPVDGAAYVTSTMPQSADRGTTFSGAITFRNTGTTVWRAADGHRLGQAVNFSSAPFGIGEMAVPHDVHPGGSATFHVTGVAPNENGEHALQWQMNRHGTRFGSTGSVNIFRVTGRLNRGVLYEQSVPTTMEAGRSYPVTLKFVNSGNTTWSSATGYALGSWNPENNFRWGVARAQLKQDAGPTSPGIFEFTVTAPKLPGTYAFQWRLLEENVEWFGRESDELLINVQGPRNTKVIGNIDGVSNEGVIRGWTCSTGIDAPIGVHVYVGAPGGAGGQHVTSGTADEVGEPEIATACATGGRHRFSIPLTKEQRLQYGGGSIHAHGISPVGGTNTLLGRSGSYLVPRVPTGTLSANPASCQIVVGAERCTVTLAWTASDTRSALRAASGEVVGSGSGGTVHQSIAAGMSRYELVLDGEVLAHTTVSARAPPTIGVPEHPAPTVTRRYVYDEHMRLCKVIEPETGSTVFGYDAVGNIVWSAQGVDLPDAAACNRDAPEVAARRIDRTYDNLNRLRTVNHPDQLGDQTLEYTQDGRIERATVFDKGQPSVTTSRTYNSLGAVTSDTQSIGTGPARTLHFGFDPMGHHVLTTYSDGSVVQQTVNAMGEATRLESPQWGVLASGITYTPSGELATLTYGNRIVRSVQRNARQLVSRVQDGNLVARSYTYDLTGNVSSVTDGVRGTSGNITLGYDSLDRLIEAKSPAYGGSGHYRFAYDTLDNLVSMRLPGKREQTYHYDAANRLELLRDPSGAAVMALGYDPAGNLTLRNGKEYSFDIGGRLRTDRVVGQYLYNGAGHRTAGLTTYPLTWHYLAGGELMERVHNAEASRHIYLGKQPLAVQTLGSTGSRLHYLHYDAQGNLAASSNHLGQVMSKPFWSPYGEPDWAPPQGIPSYAGHLRDYSGLVYMGQRYYDPVIGRFISADPLASSTSSASNFNRYRYASNNPFSYSDPTGACDQKVTGSHLCGGGGFAGDTLVVTQYAAPSGNVPVYNPNASAAVVNSDPSGWDAIKKYFGDRFYLTGPGSLTDLDAMVEAIGVPFMETPPGRGVGAGAKLASIILVGRAGDAANGFGNLSRAGEFGLGSYGALKKKVGKGSGLEVHHLIEKRFSPAFEGVRERDMLSVVVTPAEHKVFTGHWRAAFPYGKQQYRDIPEQAIMQQARTIYGNYPLILRELGL
jgi:RHS repeat-associated protein